MNAEDDRSIANKLAAEEKSGQPHKHDTVSYDAEAELSKKNPTKPVCLAAA